MTSLQHGALNFNKIFHTILMAVTFLQNLFEKNNSPKDTVYIVLDLDSTLLGTYGKQEGSTFNYHYSSKVIIP